MSISRHLALKYSVKVVFATFILTNKLGLLRSIIVIYMERMTYPCLQDPDLSSFASSNNVISEQWYSRYEIFPINQTEIGGGGTI